MSSIAHKGETEEQDEKDMLPDEGKAKHRQSEKKKENKTKKGPRSKQKGTYFV